MALNIVLHTLRMLFRNFSQALRVSVGPYLILFGVVLLGSMIVGVPLASGIDPVNPQVTPAMGLIPLLLLPLVMFVTSWVAVSWHRFILLEEYAGLLPDINERPIWPYAWKAIILGFIVIAGALPFVVLLSIFPVLAPIVIIALALVMTILSLRCGIALVGTALGQPMTFREAWDTTRDINGIIIGVAIILSLFNFVPDLILGSIFQNAPWIGSILGLGFTWLTMMMSVSILTTLYGHVVQNRPLVP